MMGLGIWLLSSHAFAQETITDLDRFKLFFMCSPVSLDVALQLDDTEFDLTQDRVATAIRSRLRAARIYNAEYVEPWLDVHVHVIGNAFSLDFVLSRWLLDPVVSQSEGPAVTWSVRATGTHANDPQYIVSALTEYTDRFIDDYLRVNEASCN